MRWETLGQVFDCTGGKNLPEGFVSHAQSPQVLPIRDGFRVYFSTRRVDASGAPITAPVFADFNCDWRPRGKPMGPVLAPGTLGCYDEHGVFPFHVVQLNGRLFGYISGWSRRLSVPVETAIGLSESVDGGTTFQRIFQGPILNKCLAEPFLVGDPFVISTVSRHFMWYIHGTAWFPASETEPAVRVYKIAQRESLDGVNWIRPRTNIIRDVLGDEECQALPTVVLWRGKFHMFFCYRYATQFRHDPRRGYKLGHAVSVDLLHWHRLNDPQIPVLSWDVEMRCYPCAFVHDDILHIAYNGNEFGKNGFGISFCRNEN